MPLRPALAGDVADVAEHPLLAGAGSRAEVDRAQADRDGELAAVLAPPVQIQPGPHGPRVRRPDVAVAEADMGLAVALRHQHFQGLAQEFLAPVAE